MISKKTIGILGGMGPDATIDLYSKIIRICQTRYGANFDEDYPPMMILNIPAPDICENLKNKEELLKILEESAKMLEELGADFIIIPCNTAHYLLPSLRKVVSIPILSMIKETSERIRKKRYKRVGLLATTTTIKQRLYEKILNKYGIYLIKPDEKAQRKIMRIIRGITAVSYTHLTLPTKA